MSRVDVQIKVSLSGKVVSSEDMNTLSKILTSSKTTSCGLARVDSQTTTMTVRSQMRKVFKTFRMNLTMFSVGKIPKYETGEVNRQVKGQLKDSTIIQHQKEKDHNQTVQQTAIMNNNPPNRYE